MLKEWQFNILFFIGTGGAVFLLVGPEFGLSIADNPTALAGVGSILTYILTQKSALTKNVKRKSRRRHEEDDENESDKEPFKSPYGESGDGG
jgi:hypothetical protein